MSLSLSHKRETNITIRTRIISKKSDSRVMFLVTLGLGLLHEKINGIQQKNKVNCFYF